MYTYTYICIYTQSYAIFPMWPWLCFMVRSKERGYRSTWTHSSQPDLVHIISQQQKQRKKSILMFSPFRVSGWNRYVEVTNDQVLVRNLYSILELSKKCWLNLWICHNIPFHHHAEMKLSLSFWVCEYLLFFLWIRAHCIVGRAL